ncbi:MAG TPA: NRDE family protein [Kiritimatiellia bacterium]|nr:NRDE family protein [Kiritimatiellia bacterium]HMP33399.1 NRDE family protein [Kiritimatiellia bacterium]
MCTLTWCSGEHGVHLFFNRDEQRTRPPAEPTARHVRNGVRFLAPIDPQAGGTWLSVNEHGVAVAILNWYDAEHANPATTATHRSRGLLVMDLAGSLDRAGSLLARLFGQDLALYRPFILVSLDAHGHGAICRWDGLQLAAGALTPGDCPLTTSSFDTAAVIAARRMRYSAMTVNDGPTPESLAAFHHSRDPRGGPYSVTMTRPDAMTVSFSHVVIGRNDVRFYDQTRQRTGEDPGYEPVSEAVLART